MASPYLHSTGVSLVVSYAIIDLATIIFVALRFYAVYLTGRKVKAHDLFCVLSLVTLFGYSAITLIGTVSGGTGLHIWDVTTVQLDISLKTFFVSSFFWAASVSSFRLSILLLYIEIFAVSPKFQWAAWVAIAFVCAFFVTATATALSLCQPIAFGWNKTISGGYCGDIGQAELAGAAFNMVLDIIIVLLPLPVVWNLQLSTDKKVGITVTFGLGLG
ncbi:hypothetical protein GGR54DRAFT_598680 [Hypoxylon sp. NC1633]|nr:hypothetical protein GGR54DRAFT_598680 [Hypoxylon sp. NC1633]